jgi:hypothetical protein
MADRLIWFRLLGTTAGTAAFCVYSQSWRAPSRALYDVPAALSAFAFITWLLATGYRAGWSARWWSLGWLVVPLSLVPTGRALLNWPMSGHMTDVLLVALVTSLGTRLPVLWRLACWLPPAIVGYMRWTSLDQGAHMQSYGAIGIAVVCALAALAVQRAVGLDDRPR